MSTYPISSALSKAAHALRPMCISKADAVHYTATTFPKKPFQGCEITIRRCEAFGYLVPPQPGNLEGDLFIDVLDIEGDILDTIGVTPDGWKYLRRVLGSKRESTTA